MTRRPQRENIIIFGQRRYLFHLDAVASDGVQFPVADDALAGALAVDDDPIAEEPLQQRRELGIEYEQVCGG